MNVFSSLNDSKNSNLLNNNWIIYAIILCFLGFLAGISFSSNKDKSSGSLNNKFSSNSFDLNKKQPEIPLSKIKDERLFVILTFGQSNAANYGQSKYCCKKEVYNYYDGRIFKARDPLLGASAKKGSVWSRLTDKLIEEKIAEKILLVPLGIGSTTVSQWSKKGEHNKKIVSTIYDLKTKNIEIDMILWHQGESDNLYSTKSYSYILDFESIIETFRENQIFAPIFVAIASYHPNENSLINKQLGCDTAIQNAQFKIIANHTNVYQGANTDKLDKIYYRHDGVHFSAIGLEKHANLWFESIKSSNKFP